MLRAQLSHRARRSYPGVVRGGPALFALGATLLILASSTALASEGDPPSGGDRGEHSSQLDEVDPVRLAIYPARVQMAKGFHADAIPLLEEALAELSDEFGERSPEVARGYDLLLEIQWRSGNEATSDADLVAERAADALQILEDAGEEHEMHLASVHNNWGNVLQVEGELERAREHYMTCYAIREKHEGPEGRSVAKVLNNLAMLQMAEERYLQAEISLRQNIRILEKHFADFPEHEALGTAYTNLGLAIARQGKPADAIEPLTRALDIRVARLGEDHIATARAHENLGAMYYQLDRLEKARDAYAEALRIYDEFFEGEVLIKAGTLTNLALAQAALGDESSTIANLDRALSIRQLELDDDSPEVAESLGLLGRYLWSIGDRDRAIEYLEEAYAIESGVSVDARGRTPALGSLPWVRVGGDDGAAEVEVASPAPAILVAVPAGEGQTIAVRGPDGRELLRTELRRSGGHPHAFVLVDPGEALAPGRYEVEREGDDGSVTDGFVLRATS